MAPFFAAEVVTVGTATWVTAGGVLLAPPPPHAHNKTPDKAIETSIAAHVFIADLRQGAEIGAPSMPPPSEHSRIQESNVQGEAKPKKARKVCVGCLEDLQFA
jgi:hypothetical protein